MTTIDPKYLKTEQYKDSSKLSARARLHSQYSSNPQSWFDWMFDLYDLPPNARVLELGAGAGWLWLRNAQRIPPGWNITVSDFSAGMVAEQRQSLARLSRPFEFREIDIQAIPFEDATFDGVIANHMLYHVPDRPKAIAEMCRVLKPSGKLYAATNGEKHLQELHQLLRNFGFEPQEWLGGFADRYSFTLENAAEQLRAQFAQAEVVRYPDSIRLSEAEPLVEYIQSYPLKLSEERLGELRAFVQQEIAKTGTMTITKDMGVAIAHS
ncbi:MAG: methyltransferase domain-containing protein [Chloroflexi bacterium]|nr:methyltransferase domain-containing protein [Chloroflexota bacterium]